jgi:hypothetical protein
MGTSSDADRYMGLTLNLSCPKCGSGGLIPLEQLDRMLFCHGCQSRFGVEPQGLVELDQDRFQVHVRSHLSDWEGHEAILQSRPAVFGAWLLDGATDFLRHGWPRWMLACVMILAIGGSIALGGRAPIKNPPLEIPDSLDGRVKMFTEALARRNMEVMIRLTDPAQYRALRIWLAHGSRIPKPVEDKEIDLRAQIVSTTPTGAAGDRADVRVQLSPTPGNRLTLDQRWAQRGSAWYFQPVRLQSASVVKGPVVPYSKRSKH